MKDMVGAPAPIVVMMRLMPWIWRKLEAVAHTLPYDAAVMTAFRIPRARFAVDRRAGAGDERVEDRSQAAGGCAGDRGRRFPPRSHRELAGQTHNVKPAVLAPAVVEFLTALDSHDVQAELTSMRFIIMHKTNAHWESGAIPGPALIARVGTLLGELAKAGVLLGAEGLRASSEGVRLQVCGRHAHASSTVLSKATTNCPPASASCARARSRTRSSGRRGRPTCSATWRSTSAPSPSPGTSA